MGVEAPELVNGPVQAAPSQAQFSPVRVRFGPRKTQDIPLAWAEFMLQTMYEMQGTGQKPRQFSDLLAMAAMEVGR